MEREGFLSAIGRFLRDVTLVDLVMLAVTGLVCWIGGWRTFNNYGDGLMIAGVIVMAVGSLSVFGSSGLAGDPTIRYSQSVSHAGLHERTKRHMLDVAESRVFSILMGLAGLVCFAAGALIKVLAR
jgi:hypothetical protein